MRSARQRVLTWVAAAAVLGAFGGLAGVAPASAQTPISVANPLVVGFPYSTTYPYVGSYPQSLISPVTATSPYTNIVNYNPTTSLTTVSYATNMASTTLPLYAPGDTYFSTATYLATIPQLSSQTNGQYCKDKTGGMVWVPTGSPPSDLVTCGS
jgi:hypothetical protein